LTDIFLSTPNPLSLYFIYSIKKKKKI